MKEQRAHPITILGNLWRVFFLIVFPVLRGFFSALQGDLARWLRGAWFDILIFLTMVAIAVLRWYMVTYFYDEHMLHLRSGILYRRHMHIPWDRIIAMSRQNSFFLKPFRAVRVRADTLGVSFRDVDFNILLTPRRAAGLMDAYLERGGDHPSDSFYSPKTSSIVALSLLTSNSFAGVVFIATFILQSGKLLGGAFSDILITTFEEAARNLAFGIPPAAAAIAYMLLGGWLIGFLFTFFRYKSMHISRGERTLHLRGGMFTQREYSILYEHIQFIDIRQSVAAKISRLYSLYVSAVGYSKQEDELSCIIPTEDAAHFGQVRRMLFPDLPPSKRMLGAAPGGLMRFIATPLYACLGVPAAAYVTVRLAPAWSRFVLFVCLMLLVPSVFFLIVRFFEFATGGISIRNGVVTMRYSKGFALHTVMFELGKIVELRVTQSPLQRIGHSCDLLIRTRAERRAVHKCRSLNKRALLELFEQHNFV